MTSEFPLTVLTQTSTQDVETLQSELAQARERIAKLEEQKQTYENHLDDLIKTVAQRSQHIRDIERDLKKIQTIQALSTTDYTSSIDPEVGITYCRNSTPARLTDTCTVRSLML